MMNNNQDKFYGIWKQSQTEVSKETSKKSLSAFQEGLKDAEGEVKKIKNKQKPRRKLPGVIGGTVVAGLTLFLIINSGLMNVVQESGNEEEERLIGEEVDEEPQDDIDVEEVGSEELLEKALNRPSYDYTVTNAMSSESIFNNKLDVFLPREWKVFETNESDDNYIQMMGENNEQMKMIMYEKQDEEVMNDQIDELINQFGATDEVSVPIEKLIEKMTLNRNFNSYYENIFPFDIENIGLQIFYNEDSNQVMELYVSTLFGYPFIYTSEFNIKDVDSWNNSIILFTTMISHERSLDLHGTYGELHPIHERPISKEVLLVLGAIGMEEVEVELYENDELGLTSYLTKTTEVERIEHVEFVEWRFTEPDIPGDSFISFGKLKAGFVINNAVQTMFSAHGIDTSLYTPSESGAPLSNFFAYHGQYLDGYFHLIEVDGEWYYSHYHGEYSVYNGGTYSERLDLFMNSIEWY